MVKRTVWFIRLLFTCVIGFVCIGLSCEHPYRTNPNLRILVGDTATKYDDFHRTNPVVSFDGNSVYYLCVDADSFSPLEGGLGSVYSVGTDGTSNQLLLEGKFDALSISHDGEKLAVHAHSGSYPDPRPESLILVVHVNATSVLYVDSLWITTRSVAKTEWSSDDEYIYYNTIDWVGSRTIIYRLNVSNMTVEEVQSIGGAIGFALCSNDSICLDDSLVPQMEIEPVSEEHAIGAYGYFGSDFLMRNISGNTLCQIPDSLNPYLDGSVGFPYWFPDGEAIVFSAHPYVAGSGAPAEIWILENIFEQIEE